MLLPFLAACAASALLPGQELSAALKREHIHRGAGPVYPHLDKSESHGKDGDLTVFDASSEGRQLKLSIFDLPAAEQARELEDELVSRIQASYKPYVDPYFFSQGRSKTCPAEYAPRVTSATESWGARRLVTTFADHDGNVPVCSEAEKAKKAQLLFLRCGKRLIEIEKMVSLGQYGAEDEAEIQSFRCD